MRPVAAAFLLGAAACHRAPEEPLAATTSSAAVAAPREAVTPNAASPCPPDPEQAPPSKATGAVLFPESGARVEVEVVSSEHDTEKGLMYRTHMEHDHGMLFQLDRRVHSFWMHNTCISLDLIYIDGDRILGVVEKAPVLDDQPRSVGQPGTDVLEVNAGWAAKHGVRAGQKVVLPSRAR